MIVLLSVWPGTLESTMTEDLSPAERYAAARKRATEQATALASFREMYDFGLDPFQIEACQALETGKGVYEVVMQRGLLTRAQLNRALDPETMTGPK